MPTAKPPYKGDGTGMKCRDFSDKLKETLRPYYRDEAPESDPVFGHPADAFVAHILAEARWAISELHWQQFDSTKQEVRAEQADLRKRLIEVHDKLLNLSPDFTRQLDIDADPQGCADEIKKLIVFVEQASERIDGLRSAKKPSEKRHQVELEMAVRVLRALKGYGIEVATTGSAYFGYTSDAVQILKAIGDDIGLELVALTWRDIIIEAKRAAPDLQ